MKNFIFGTLFGIVVATVGFSGIAALLDTGVNKVKTTVQEQAQSKPDHQLLDSMAAAQKLRSQLKSED